MPTRWPNSRQAVPNNAGPNNAGEDDAAACRALIRQGSRSFFAASLLLPSRVRKAATALYAFCRVADDLIDQGDGGPAALNALRERLDRIYAGNPVPFAADRAFAEVATAYAIPREMPEALIEGFAWDAEGRRYTTLGELRAYAARVAGSVGAMMAILMGVRAPEAAARACDLGVAMQLTNIARDVGEDAAAGRLYLPTCWLAEAGVDPEAFLADPAFTPALGDTVARLLASAEDLYERADSGIAALPLDCRPAIAAASRFYRAIGLEVARAGYDSISRRAVVPSTRKIALLAGSIPWLTPSRASTFGAAFVPLPETRFLVEAMHSAPQPLVAVAPEEAAGWSRAVEMFIALEQRKTLTRAESRT